MLTTINYVFYFAASLANLVFVVLYGTTAKWWRNPLGRVLFGEAAVVFVVFTKSTLHLFGVPFPEWVTVAINGLVAAALIAYCVTYFCIWRKLKARDAE